MKKNEPRAIKLFFTRTSNLKEQPGTKKIKVWLDGSTKYNRDSMKLFVNYRLGIQRRDQCPDL